MDQLWQTSLSMPRPRRPLRLPVWDNLEAQCEGPHVVGVLEVLDVAVFQEVPPQVVGGLALEEAVVEGIGGRAAEAALGVDVVPHRV